MTDKMKDVKEVTERVMKIFTKYYVQSLKEVAIADSKRRRYEAAKEAIKEAKNAGKAPKPRRPRKKGEKRAVLSAKIQYSYELDSGIDPYIVYAISAELNGEKVTTYKRYSQFKKFHSKYGSKVKTAKLPPPSSQFGSRDTSWDFRRQREKSLQEYVDAICAEPKSIGHKDVNAFFKLGQKDDRVFRDTFELAYKKTRSHLWQWRWVVYETEEEALSRLVCEEVKDKLWYSMISGLPSNATVRAKAIQTYWKAIQVTVGPPVAAGWKACRSASEKLKPTIISTLDSVLEPYLKSQEDLKTKLGDLLQPGLAPVTKAIKDLVGPLSQAILPKLAEAIFDVASPGKFQTYLTDLEKLIQAEDTEKMKVMQNDVADLRLALIKKVDESMEKAVEPIIGDFKSKVSLEALGGVFTPIAKLNQLGKSFFEFIDPANQFHVIEELLKWKKKIKENGREKVEETLDSEEYDIDNWPVWRLTRNIRWAGWSAVWSLYQLLPESYSVVRQMERFVEDFSKINEVAFHEKFSFKFGDYLHEAAKTCNTPDEFNAAVDRTFLIGFERCIKYYQKHVMFLIATSIKRILEAMIFDKLEKLLVDGAKDAIEPLASTIVAPLDNLIDVNSIVSEVISTKLEEVLIETMDAIHPSLKTTLARMAAMEPTQKQIWATPLPPVVESSPPASPVSSPPTSPTMSPKSERSSEKAESTSSPAASPAPAAKSSSSKTSTPAAETPAPAATPAPAPAPASAPAAAPATTTTESSSNTSTSTSTASSSSSSSSSSSTTHYGTLPVGTSAAAPAPKHSNDASTSTDLTPREEQQTAALREEEIVVEEKVAEAVRTPSTQPDATPPPPTAAPTEAASVPVVEVAVVTPVVVSTTVVAEKDEPKAEEPKTEQPKAAAPALTKQDSSPGFRAFPIEDDESVLIQ